MSKIIDQRYLYYARKKSVSKVKIYENKNPRILMNKDQNNFHLKRKSEKIDKIWCKIVKNNYKKGNKGII